MTDLHLAARSVIAAYEAGGVPAVEDWLKREFAVAAAHGRAEWLADHLAELDRLVQGVPDLPLIDAGD